MKVRIKLITPVHIGSGENISPIEYFIDRERGFFNVLNMESLFLDQAFGKYRENFLKEASSSRYIGKIISDQTLLKKHIKYSIPISLEARQNNPIEVKSFIKSGGRPYLPGSSIKGAMISALIYYALKERSQALKDRNLIITSLRATGKRDNEYRELLDLAYGFLSKAEQKNEKGSGDRFLNLLDVSDSAYLDSAKTLKVELVKVEGGGKKESVPIMCETMKESTETEIDIRCKKCRLKEEEIFQICHDFYLKVAKKDGLNFQNQPYLLRLGQGASAFSTSLLILAEELGINDYPVKPPRTRKRILAGPEKKPLGFVQLIRLGN